MWPAKGRLAEGADADICVWDPSVSWTISAATQHQNVDHTPYEGFKAKGRARLTFVNGVLAARDGEPTGRPARPLRQPLAGEGRQGETRGQSLCLKFGTTLRFWGMR